MMPRLSNEDRARALGILSGSQDFVARRFNVSRLTISRLVQRVINTTGRLAGRLPSGALRIMSIRQDKLIRQRHLCDRYVTAEPTAATLVGNLGRNISRNTVRIRLRDGGIICRRPYRGPVLIPRHHRERQQWTVNNRGRQWRNVVFSDESCFNLFNADGVIRI